MPKYILFLAKLMGKVRPFLDAFFWMEKNRYILWTISYMWGNVNYYKSVHHPIPTRENRKHPRNFQNKSASSAFNWVPWYILFLAKLKGRGRPFLVGPSRGATLWNYLQEHLVVIRDEKVSPFVKFEKILPLLCFLLDPLTNKHCRTWSSMINLWIDYKTYQK